MNIYEYTAFEAVKVIGNQIIVCLPEKYKSLYSNEYRLVMDEILSFLPEEIVKEFSHTMRTIKINNGSTIKVMTYDDETRGHKASELIFTHPKEEYDQKYIYALLACIEDKKHRRIIGI